MQKQASGEAAGALTTPTSAPCPPAARSRGPATGTCRGPAHGGAAIVPQRAMGTRPRRGRVQEQGAHTCLVLQHILKGFLGQDEPYILCDQAPLSVWGHNFNMAISVITVASPRGQAFVQYSGNDSKMNFTRSLSHF